MARQKEFDEEEVLEKAIAVFWKRGYAGASIQNLIDGMKIHRGSLYSTFKDKKTLFFRCLELYESRRLEQMRNDLPPIEAIQAWFQSLVEKSVSGATPSGCFIINTLKDVENHHSEIRKAVAQSLLKTENLLFTQICRGQADGSISPNLDPRRTAQAMLGMTVGMRSLSHLKPNRVFLQNIADSALSLLY
ncbi:MAG: TetR/AcrR family transcriptional regulator [SAR324 cluster bacterium]|nr:TetR/AcrR family transcriptional regulator [SAR324 cluster bacterium]